MNYFQLRHSPGTFLFHLEFQKETMAIRSFEESFAQSSCGGPPEYLCCFFPSTNQNIAAKIRLALDCSARCEKTQGKVSEPFR